MVTKVVSEKMKLENEVKKTARLPNNVLKKLAPPDIIISLISYDCPIPL